MPDRAWEPRDHATEQVSDRTGDRSSDRESPAGSGLGITAVIAAGAGNSAVTRGLRRTDRLLVARSTGAATMATDGQGRIREAIDQAGPEELVAIDRALELAAGRLPADASVLHMAAVTLPGGETVTFPGGLAALQELQAYASGRMVSRPHPAAHDAPPQTEDAFIESFERAALAGTLTLLRQGRERAESERRRYGLVSTPERALPGPNGPITVAGGAHMAANSDSQALAATARQLSGQWAELRRTREQLHAVMARRRLADLGNSVGAGLLRPPEPRANDPLATPPVPATDPLAAPPGGVPLASGARILDPNDVDVMTSALAGEETRWRASIAQATARFPVLGPLAHAEDPTTALETIGAGASDSAAWMLSGELDRNIAAISQVEQQLTTSRIWSLPAVVDRTRSQLGLHPAQREYVWTERRQQAQAEHDELVGLAITAVTFALWILSAATAGTATGVALAATSAVGSVAAAGYDTYDYLRRDAEAHAALDPADSISADEPSLVWLAVALIGAGLDVGAAAHGWRELRATARTAAATQAAEDIAALRRRAEAVRSGLGQRVENALPGAIAQSAGAMARWEPAIQQAQARILARLDAMKARLEQARAQFERFTSGERRDQLLRRTDQRLAQIENYRRDTFDYGIGNAELRDRLAAIERRLASGFERGVANLEDLVTPVPWPTAGEQAHIDQYLSRLQDMRAADRANSVEEFQAAEQDLIAIERRAALRGPGEEHLMEHIEALARERRFLRHDGAEATVAGTAHPSCEAAIRARSRLAGRTFSEIKAELGGLDPVIDVPASATRPGETRNPAVAAIKLTWRFDDGSSVRIDVPGVGTRPFVSGSQPHLARVAPDEVHFSDSGIPVPAASTPAHIRVVLDDVAWEQIRQARMRVAGERAATD
jgi:hypothetical protein